MALRAAPAARSKGAGGIAAAGSAFRLMLTRAIRATSFQAADARPSRRPVPMIARDAATSDLS
jgi:hypothetical protein